MEQRSFNHNGYQAFLNEQQLMGSRCTECSQVYLPPRAMCSRCYQVRMEWVPFSGKGTVTGVTTIYVAPSAMVAAGYSRENPYVTAVVKLEEGPSISGQVIGTDRFKAENLTVGTVVQAAFIQPEGGDPSKTRLAFEPVVQPA